MHPRTLDDEARNLAEQWVPFAMISARRLVDHYRIRPDCELAEEVVGASLLGLCRAALTYRPGGPTGFPAYAWVIIVREVKQELYRARPKGYRRTRDRGGGPEILGIEDRDLAVLPDTSVDDADEREQLRAALERLPAPEREAIRWAFEEGLSERAIGREKGVSPWFSGMLVNSAINRLRHRP